MNCRIAKTLMQDAADGKLNGADTGLINAHLEECAACREEYRQTALLLEALRAIPVPPPSPGFAERALRNATRSQPPAANGSPPLAAPPPTRARPRTRAVFRAPRAHAAHSRDRSSRPMETRPDS